jgi:hypothetical protein
MGYPIAGWFTMEHPIEMDDDWGYPYFGKPPYSDTGFIRYLMYILGGFLSHGSTPQIIQVIRQLWY